MPIPPCEESTLSSDLSPEFVRERLRDSGSIWIEAYGHSMSPSLRPGDRICIQPKACPFWSDVVLVCRPGRLVLHRIIACFPTPSGWRYLTKGDATRRTDGWCALAEILGTAVHVMAADGSQKDLHSRSERALAAAFAATSWSSGTVRPLVKKMGRIVGRLV